MFEKPVRVPDFNEIEERVLEMWEERDSFGALNEKNRGGKKFSFIDGPITANNPMGVHHAWGRTYKDVYQRFMAMRGREQRYQNGFDCQGLWVEVEVERDLGLNSKREIEEFGLAEFSRACRERVDKYSERITRQSQRLGMWMDWDDSYYTHSDRNIEHIWAFLKKCAENGWVQRGGRVMPWCVRCGTTLSQHELVGTDTYQEMTHTAVTLRFPIAGREKEYLLVWTTTPWTMAGNVACAVHPELPYLKAKVDGDIYYLSKGTAEAVLPDEHTALGEVPGTELVGLRYRGPWDELPAQEGIEHRVVGWDEVSEEEGTGIVHIAPGSGVEDYALGLEEGLSVVKPIDGEGRYVEGFGPLAGLKVLEATELILKLLDGKGMLFGSGDYTHRYPVCWRCKEEIVFNFVDEWFLACDEIRPRMKAAAEKVNWVPESVGKRMQDWLDNMGDWAISRKRYWGLPLPFYCCENADCGKVTVVGSVKELRELAVDPEMVDGLPELHKPWIDEVRIACPECGDEVERVPEVGDCWLDAGIVPFSTLDYMYEDQSKPDTTWNGWYPADFVMEMREQIRLWFYSMLFMSVTLEDRAPYESLFVYEKVMDVKGEPMHRSFGNSIDFDDAVKEMGADVTRWMYVSTNPATNVRFGYEPAKDVVRKLLTLWNVYAFFLTYAELDGFDPMAPAPAVAERAPLDRWIMSRLNGLTERATEAMEGYRVYPVVAQMEAFWDDLSNWYVRLSRRRFWKSQTDDDKTAAYATLHEVLVGLAKLMGPLVPFLAEELYQNLVLAADPKAPNSLFLSEWPAAGSELVDAGLEAEMETVRRAVGLGRAARATSGVKTRQPLGELVLGLSRPADRQAVKDHLQLVLDEVNVKEVRFVDGGSELLTQEVKPNYRSLGPRFGGQMREAATAIEGLEPAVCAAAVENGDSVRIEVGGESHEIGPDDLDVRHRELEGYAVANEGGVVAGLALALTEELRVEGKARELVHAVQNARREAGFEVSDRIRLTLSGADVAEVLARFEDHIANEVLATEMRQGEPEPGMESATLVLDGEKVAIGVARVAQG